MKIQLLSDLHFEFYKDHGRHIIDQAPVAGDVLVLAGDVMPLQDEKEVAELLGRFSLKWPHVLYVPGNHEYYKTDPVQADELLTRASFILPNLHVLNPGSITIDGVHFIGGTMWFPPSKAPIIRDHVSIRNFIPWVYDKHDRCMELFGREVSPQSVIITHHLPHSASTPDQFKNDRSNDYFVCSDAGKILSGGPQLWLHGHTHSACDYFIGKTRVVANPKGYPGEKSAGPHDQGLTIEVPAGTRR